MSLAQALPRSIFTSRGFLVWGGIVLVILAVVGFLGIFTKEGSPQFYLTDGENYAHLILGIVALAAVYVPGLNGALAPYYRPIVILVGLIALFFGIYGFVVAGQPDPNTFGLANLENPADNILHLVVAAWAFWSSLRPGAESMA
jgi:hypothetical protein